MERTLRGSKQGCTTQLLAAGREEEENVPRKPHEALRGRSSEEQGDDVTLGNDDVEDDDYHEVDEPSLMAGNAIQVIDDNDSDNNDSIVGP